jgi:uncharacterized protein with FMN-binding domain
VRKETRLALGVVGLSALTTSYLLGNQQTDAGLALGAAAATATTSTTEPSATAEAQVTSPAEATPDTAQATTEASVTAEPSPTATSTPSATPTETAAPTEAPAASTGTSGTFTSSTVQYRYGRIQLEITVTDGSLTDINLLQATTEGRGYEQAPPILVDAAIQAGGTNFGNLSGATFTTQAFKQALTDALNQAGM